MKPPLKAIKNQIDQFFSCLDGEYEKYCDMTVREVWVAIFMLENLIEGKFGQAIDLYYHLSWQPDADLDYKIIDYLNYLANEEMNKNEQTDQY